MRVMIEPTTKKLGDMAKGEVWSINPKSTKFVLSSIDPQANIITANELVNGQLGKEAKLPYQDYASRSMCRHKGLARQEREWTPELWQRVTLKGGALGLTGTVIDVGDKTAPDRIIVLWDAPVNCRWVAAKQSDDLDLTNGVCDDPMLRRAKEARALVKDLQSEHARGYEQQTRQAMQDELAKTKAREQYTATTKHGIAKRVQIVAKQTMNTYASDFKAMIEAGMLSLTAGEEEGAIDRIPEMIDSHLDSIKIKVNASTDEEDLKIPAMVAITQLMADTMLSQYFLTRNAFIRKHGNRLHVISKDGEKLGGHFNVKAATKQLHAFEYNHRRGLI